MSSSSASLEWGICCSILRLEGTVHLGSQTNRNQASATENWALWGHSVSFGCCLENVCTWHSWLSVPLSLDIPGQNTLSLSFRRHFSVPMCPWCIICNICGRSLLGITRWCLLRMRPFPTLRSSLNSKTALCFGGICSHILANHGAKHQGGQVQHLHRCIVVFLPVWQDLLVEYL